MEDNCEVDDDEDDDDKEEEDDEEDPTASMGIGANIIMAFVALGTLKLMLQSTITPKNPINYW